MADDPTTTIYKAIWGYLFPTTGGLTDEIKSENRFSEIDRMVYPPANPQPADLPNLYLTQSDLDADVNAGNAMQGFQTKFEAVCEVDLTWPLNKRNELLHKAIKAMAKGKLRLGLDMVRSWSMTAKTIFQTTEDTGEPIMRGFRLLITVEYTLTDAILQA